MAAFAVRFAGQVIVGKILSLTVTLKEQVAELPLASVTRNVFVVRPLGKVPPFAMPLICVVADPVQLSEPTGVEYVTVAEQSPGVMPEEIGAGHVIVGN